MGNEREKQNSIESNTQFNLACKFKSLEFLMWQAHHRTTHNTQHSPPASTPCRAHSMQPHIKRAFCSRALDWFSVQFTHRVSVYVCGWVRLRWHEMRFVCLNSWKTIANFRICSSWDGCRGAFPSSFFLFCFARTGMRHVTNLRPTWFETEKSSNQYYAKHTMISTHGPPAPDK